VGDASDGLSCPETITRTYSVTDSCGNFIEVDQLITVQDVTPPTASAPAPIIVECITDVPAPDVLVVTDEADNCGVPTVAWVGDASDGLSCPETITRTYSVTDSCGNFIEVDQLITVQDVTPPTASAPAPIIVECITDVPAPDVLVVTDEADNCGVPTVAWVGDASDGLSCPETITRTYSVTDSCGNFIEVDQLITVQDVTPPTASAPAPIIVECITDVPAPDVLVVTDEADNCGVPTVAWVGDASDGLSCPETITRTYSVTDSCGNFIEVDQLITVQDVTPPTASAPAPIIVECITDVPAPDVLVVTDEADNCGVPTVAWVGDASDGLSCPETITRTYSVTDSCGNFIEVDQLITVQDVTPPTASAPAPIIVECITDVPAPDVLDEADNCGVPTVAWVGDGVMVPETITRTYSVTDSCVHRGGSADHGPAPPTASAPAPIIVECITMSLLRMYCLRPITAVRPLPGWAMRVMVSCPETITRTYSVTDSCGNFIEVDQLITVQDVTPPTASAPAPIIVECITDVPAPDVLVVTDEADNCGVPTVAWVGDASDGLSCPETITRTYSVTDSCGNFIEVDQLITVQDVTPPTASAPAPIIVECITDVPAPDVLVVTDEADNCGVPTVAWVGDASDGLSCPETITRTYSVTDSCGNFIEVDQLITVQDVTPPTASAPAPIIVECITDVPAPDVLVVTDEADNCGVPTVAWVGDASDGLSCPETITRTYSVTDSCGNFIEVDQLITVQDVTPPTASAPAPIIVECITDVPAPDVLVVTDEADNCGVPTVAWVGDASDGLSCPETITRTYSVTDSCGNFIEVDQLITVQDVTPPTASAPAPIIVECITDVPAPDVLVVTDEADNCGVPTVAWVGDASDGLSCPETITRTYSVTDSCGNFIEVDQLITVQDVTPPTASAPAPIIVECITDVPAPDVLVVTDEADNCGVPTVAWVGDANDGLSCPETITRTYSVTDSCGNFIEVDQLITINDITAPVAVCQDITVQLDGTGNATITAADVDGGSSDNCGIASMSLDVTTFDCSNVGDNTVTLTVEDACGNLSSCVATVTVEDNLPPSITCQVDVAVTAPAGDCSVPVNGIEPAAISDNCGGSVVSYRLEGATTGFGLDDASGTAFNKGVTTVWYIITDSNNNADSCSFDVTVVTTVVPPDQASSDRTEVCPGDGDIVLSYSGGVMPEGGVAHWYDDAGLTNIIGDGNNLSVLAPVVTSTYYVRFEGDCDTTAAVSTTVTIKSLTVDPVSASVDRSEVCAGDGNIILSYAGGDPGSNGVAVWYDDSGFTTSIGTGNNLSIAAPSDTTIYYVRFEADCDTSAAVSVEVDVWPTPAPIFEEKYEIACTNGPLYRYVAGGFAGSTFSWVIVGGTIVDDFNDTIYVDWGDVELTGSLELTEISVNGCVSSPVSIEVEVGGPDLDLGDDVGVCRGSSVTITPEGTFASYLWQDGSTAGSYTTDQEGWVVLEVTDNNGCAARDSVFVTVWELPVVDLGPDTTLCGDEGITLNAGADGIFYNWSTGETTQEIIVYRGGSDEIWVEVEDLNGCISGDTIVVNACDVEFYFRDIPTAITPGVQDGKNDVWIIEKLSQYSQAEVEIYDRWGTLVWKSEPGYSNPWDGLNMRGRAVPMDSYHFVIKLNSGEKNDVVTGIITVIR
jgi:gliding motility-associated-like protein